MATGMGMFFKYFLILLLIGLAAFAVYAWFDDPKAPVREITIDVPMPANS